MNHAKDLIDAFAQYYSTTRDERAYSVKMATTITDAYAWINPQYKAALYKEVVRSFVPTAARPLPDMAAITVAERALPPQSTMASVPRETRADLERTDVMLRSRINRQAKEEGEVNHQERQRIRGKIEKGEASAYEMWWLHCIEHKGGEYKAMPKRFAEQHEGAARW